MSAAGVEEKGWRHAEQAPVKASNSLPLRVVLKDCSGPMFEDTDQAMTNFGQPRIRQHR